MSLGISQVLGDILPNSQASRTVLDTSVRLGENVALAGFWAPFDNATSAPVVGLTANIGFNGGEVTPRPDDLLGKQPLRLRPIC